MELLTRSTDPDWDRVVYVYVDKIKDTSKLVLDSEMYKLLIVDEGSMTIRCGQSKKIVVAPAIVLLSDEEISFADEKDAELTEEEAREQVEDAAQSITEIMENGGSYEEAEDVLLEDLGLEMDYIFDLLL